MSCRKINEFLKKVKKNLSTLEFKDILSLSMNMIPFFLNTSSITLTLIFIIILLLLIIMYLYPQWIYLMFRK